MGGAISMFMFVSCTDQQSQASSNCDNSGLMLLRNRLTLCVSQTTFLVPLHERAIEIHREKMAVYSEFISAQS